jgi:hypothetical protein
MSRARIMILAGLLLVLAPFAATAPSSAESPTHYLNRVGKPRTVCDPDTFPFCGPAAAFPPQPLQRDGTCQAPPTIGCAQKGMTTRVR